MKRFNFKHFFLLIFLGLLVAFPSAFSSWIIYDVDGTTLINSATLTPVCYIDSDTDSNKYYLKNYLNLSHIHKKWPNCICNP